jgi:carbonic anhydrase
MPYIKKERRAALDTIVDGLVARLRSIDPTKGDVNYVVTRIALAALVQNRVCYSSLSDAVAALRDAADEIAVRVLGHYECEALAANGDVVEFDQIYNEIRDKFAPKVAAELYLDLQKERNENS